jgi:RNA polymerase sigma-70 factor (sigma-E family)
MTEGSAVSNHDRDQDYTEFVLARVTSLRRTAFLLCGDWHRAEDLVQTALVRLYVAWPRIRAAGAPDAYVRKILVNAVIDESRRPFRRFERTAAEPVDVPARTGNVDAAMDVRAALAGLTPGQRAVVVLRYWEDLSVEATAGVLGCSVGTVKSQAAKGLAALRRLLVAGDTVLEGRA